MFRRRGGEPLVDVRDDFGALVGDAQRGRHHGDLLVAGGQVCRRAFRRADGRGDRRERVVPALIARTGGVEDEIGCQRRDLFEGRVDGPDDLR